MSNLIFKLFSLFFCFVFINFFDFDIVYCKPLKSFMEKDFIEGRVYFYFDKNDTNLRNQLIKTELNLLVNKFDSVSFNLVQFFQNNNKFFFYNHSNNHPNLMLTFPNHLSNRVFQYYYSFVFSHNSIMLNSTYYEFFSNKDLSFKEFNQYWRSYFSANNNQLVNFKKYNINFDNYMLNTDLKFKTFKILKLYLK